jgi:hypothetical protein
MLHEALAGEDLQAASSLVANVVVVALVKGVVSATKVACNAAKAEG